MFSGKKTLGEYMKIFDFTNGIKGKQLDEIKWGGSGGLWKDGKRVSKESTQVNRYQYAEKLWSKGGQEIKPENYGVEAICFCLAHQTNDGVVYDWFYVPTKVCMETKIPYKWDNAANAANAQGMINDLMECIAFEEDNEINECLRRLNALSYEELKKEWSSLHVR